MAGPWSRDAPAESAFDRQIREAQERGDFDDLPGAGKPIPDLDAPYDELWWVKRKLRDEGVSYLPPTLALRKEVEDLLDGIASVRSEADVRQLVGDLNARIRHLNRTTVSGPPTTLMPLDVEQVVNRWRRVYGRPEEQPD